MDIDSDGDRDSLLKFSLILMLVFMLVVLLVFVLTLVSMSSMMLLTLIHY